MTTPSSILDHRYGARYGGHLGHPNLYEVTHLLTRLLNAKTAIEVGTERGNGAAMIGSALKVTGGILHTVDIHECVDAVAKCKSLGLDNVYFHSMDGREWLRHLVHDVVAPPLWHEPKAVGELHGQVDLAFEDSAHTEDHTLACLDLMHPLMRKGGVIVVDDIHMPPVRRAIERFLYIRGADYTMLEAGFDAFWGGHYAYLLKEV